MIYVGTDIGFFYYDETNGWMPFGTNLPRKVITDVEINPTSGKIYASTYGRGIWVADLPDENCYFVNQEDIYISSPTYWYDDQTICADIYVTNNSSLFIAADIIQGKSCQIIVESGSRLEINYGGSIETGQVTIESGGECDIYNSGEIILNNNTFKAELGSIINIHSNGKISIKE